ncbi:MAG TPA: TetR/AcrR family transcriptional regulator [Solirubrobacteraceae bacterium]|nr:TetR/AcrR family transcriptional regulator [Solirubrobacteraceae bacterium]
MSPREPKSDQRERLLNGMAQVVGRRGYPETTIALVIAQAGVSRSTFYEHFTDKEDCFLAAFENLAPLLLDELKAIVGGASWGEKQAAVLNFVFDPAHSDLADSWRLLLTHARAGTPRIRNACHDLLGEIELHVGEIRENVPTGLSTLDIAPKPLVGGIHSVLSLRRVKREMDDPGEIFRALLHWTSSYAVPHEHPRRDAADWTRLGRGLLAARPEPPEEAESNRPLPRGSAHLPASEVDQEHHNRIVHATASLMRERGYAAITIADIVAAASVSRGVFYKHFLNKREVFLAGQTLALQDGIGLVSAAYFARASWPERLWYGLEALSGYLASTPDLAHLMLIESYAAGSAALERLTDSIRALSVFLEEGYNQSPAAAKLSHVCSEAIAGAIHELIYDAAIRDRTARLPELVPQAAYICLAPFLGPLRARETVDELLQARLPGLCATGRPS